MSTIANITVAQLLSNGWSRTEDSTVPYEKKIPNRNPLNNSEETEIVLVVHSLYNVWRFAIQFPDGGLLNFTANTMQELQEFEKRLDFFDPPF